MTATEPAAITPILADAISGQLQMLALVGEPFTAWIERTEQGLSVMLTDSDGSLAIFTYDGAVWTRTRELDAFDNSPEPDPGTELSSAPTFLSPRRFRDVGALPEDLVTLAAAKVDEYYVEITEIHHRPMTLVQTLIATGWRVTVSYTVPASAMESGGIHVRAQAPSTDRLHDKAIQRALGRVPGTVEIIADWQERDPDEWDFAVLGFHVRNEVWDRTDSTLNDYAIAIAPSWTLAPDVDQPLKTFGSAPSPSSNISLTPVPAPSDAEIADRRARISQWATKYDFVDEVRPATPQAVKALLEKQGHGSAGYYLLEFENGECYVGQSISIDRRLAQHLLTHSDTASIRVKVDADAPSADSTLRHLLRNERTLIHAAQTEGLHARNKSEMTVVSGTAALNDLIPTAEQTAWLNDPRGENRRDIALGRQLNLADPAFTGSARNFANLNSVAGKDGSWTIHRLIGDYLRRCIAYPNATEAHYWNISAPLKAGRGGPPARWRTVCCLTVGMVETFVILKDRKTDVLEGFLQVNGSALFGDLDPDTAYIRLKRQHPGIDISPANYHDSGPDNLNIDFPNLAALVRLLNDPHITRAAATATLLLMRVRKAPTTRQITHCPELVTAAWEAV
ncbi:GIY-YIG nuclease family protein [Gordonia sp. NPDC003504]